MDFHTYILVVKEIGCLCEGGTVSMALKKKSSRKERVRSGRWYEVCGIVLFAICVIVIGSFGAVGRSFTYVFRFFVGTWNFIVPLLGMYVAIHMMVKRDWPRQWTPRHSGFTLLLTAVLIVSHYLLFRSLDGNSSVLAETWKLVSREIDSTVPLDIGGGMIGAIGYASLRYLFDDVGTLIVSFVFILVGLLLVTSVSYAQLWRKLRNSGGAISTFTTKTMNGAWDSVQRRRLGFKEKRNQRRTEKDEDVEEGGPASSANANVGDVPVIHDYSERTDGSDEKKLTREQGQLAWSELSESGETAQQGTKELATENGAPVLGSMDGAPEVGNYSLPPFSLLEKPKKIKQGEHKGMTANAKKLEQTLESFGVGAKVTQIHRGPAVTRYEVQPDIGVKVSRIVNLTDDLALALAAKDIRMEAPIPGKSAIGIEVPNPEVSIVNLRDVLESPQFHEAESKVSIALGRDISGESIVGDMSKMPHLLVAGATGSGKSVCINGIIASVLYKAKPNEVKFLMVDPKMVELNVYNGIPHLIAPVVTDPRHAALALKKIVAEMEKRYELFAESGARDISRYNQLMAEQHPEEPYPALPYIVVIVDELADLMMVAPQDVEDAICRLAQMARAAGIHLIIATQRPSVDVITGLIKANIPSRIAFGVSSQADSRTILDMGGAEKLLGRGDMLYLPVGAAKPTRIQGAFLSDQEVDRIVTFCKKQQEAHYNEDIIVQEEDLKEDKVEVEDELYPEAVKLVVEAETASVSLLQRRLRIGYTRAARLIDEMEARGIVGPYEGSKPRDVLITRDQFRAGEEVTS